MTEVVQQIGKSNHSVTSSTPLEKRVTAIIKTFERPKALTRLIRSIRRFYPDLAIIVADDSVQATACRDAEFLRLNPDVGLSAGRNAVLSRVETPYLLLLDDDLEFTAETNIERLSTIVENEKDITLAAGNFMLWEKNPEHRWYRFGQPRVRFSPQPWNGSIHRNGNRLLLTPGYVEHRGSYFVCDIVNNFFLADAHKVRAIGGWDADLKVYEHWDFFIRFKEAGLKAAYCPEVTVRHWQTRTPGYSNFRQREQFRGMAMKKHALTSFVNYEGMRFVLEADGTIREAA